MKTLRLGFTDTYENAKRFFMDTLGKYYHIIRDDQNPDYLIYGDPDFGRNHVNYTNCKKIFFTGENVRPNYNECSAAMTFDHENSSRHYRLPLYVPEMEMMTYEGWTKDRLYLINKKIDVEYEYSIKDRFCSFVQSNGRFEFRNKFFHFLDERMDVDSGGPLFNNTGHILPRDGMHHKIDFMRTRKFNIAFENGSYPGYVTEKILNAFYANTIPIYFGSPTVFRDFNESAFINVHRYKTYNEVYDAIMEIHNDKNKYLDMLSQPAFVNNVPNEHMNYDSFYKWFDTFVYEDKNV